jgi:hypothetical protein
LEGRLGNRRAKLLKCRHVCPQQREAIAFLAGYLIRASGIANAGQVTVLLPGLHSWLHEQRAEEG